MKVHPGAAGRGTRDSKRGFAFTTSENFSFTADSNDNITVVIIELGSNNAGPK
jgi:hypothetical protein